MFSEVQKRQIPRGGSQTSFFPWKKGGFLVHTLTRKNPKQISAAFGRKSVFGALDLRALFPNPPPLWIRGYQIPLRIKKNERPGVSTAAVAAHHTDRVPLPKAEQKRFLVVVAVVDF